MYPAKKRVYFKFLNDDSGESIQKQVVDFEKLAESFISNLDRTQSTRKTYKGSLAQFLRWLTKENNPYPSRETILRFKEMLDARGLKPTTRSIYLVAVRQFFSWLHDKKIFPNISKGIKGPRPSQCYLRDPLSINQLKKLLSFVPRNTIKGRRDFALINLMVRTGLRMIEIERASLRDLEINGDKAILWIRGKGKDGKDECVVLHEQALQPILGYLRSRNINLSKPSDPLFSSESKRNFGDGVHSQTINKIIVPYMKEAGIKNDRIVPYSLRHSFACYAFKAGASFHEVKVALRHKNPSDTMRYLKGIEKEVRLQGGAEKGVADVLSKTGI